MSATTGKSVVLDWATYSFVRPCHLFMRRVRVQQQQFVTQNYPLIVIIILPLKFHHSRTHTVSGQGIPFNFIETTCIVVGEQPEEKIQKCEK